MHQPVRGILRLGVGSSRRLQAGTGGMPSPGRPSRVAAGPASRVTPGAGGTGGAVVAGEVARRLRLGGVHRAALVRPARPVRRR